MLRLIVGVAGSGKTARITDEIRQRVARRETGVILLVPEQYSHEAERELCRVCGDGLSRYAEVLSFSRLAVRVAQETGTGGKIVLDKGGRLLCMSLALSQLGGRLKLFSAAAHRAELQAALLQTVTALKTAHVGSEALRAAALSAENSLSDKLSDLALCLDAYDAILAQGRADPADRLARLAETLGQSAVCCSGHIYIDGFTDFTGAELAVIRTLLKKNAALTVCLSCDGLHGKSEHFALSRTAANTLLRYAREAGVETALVDAPDISGKAAPLVFLDEKLYSFTDEVRENTDGCIAVLRAESVRSECEAAAANCLELVRSGACRYRDIAVAVRGFEGYAAVLEEAFRFYGVPLFTARRGSVLQKPVAALIADAFEILQGGWETDAVLSYMKTGLTGLSVDDRDLIERYAVMWRVRGALWYRRAPWSQHPAGYGAERTPESLDALSRLNAIRRLLTAPLARLAESGDRAKTASEQAKALAAFLSELRLPETLADKARRLEEAGRALYAEETLQLWELTVKCLEQSAAILGDTPMTQEQFSKLFLQTLSQYDVSAIPVSLDRVQAGDMDRMRRRRIKHLMILGASDDRLPGALGGGGILSGEECDELDTLGIPLGGRTLGLARELSLIYSCVALPSETLTLSYCALTEGGARARPSFLINRAKLLFGLEESPVHPETVSLAAPEPAFLLALGSADDAPSRLARACFSETEADRGRLDALADRAGRGRGSLSEQTVKTLYGETLRLTPSRTDAFSACRLYYFLRYGLKLSEKERAGFEAPELGSFMHYVLENVAAEIAAGPGFKAVEEETVTILADRFAGLYAEEKLGGLADKAPRFVYLFERLRPTIRRVAADMVRELSRSDFVPLDFELGLGQGGALPPVRIGDGDNALYISGIADRVDGCEKDGKLYIRVVDYKTGKTTFSLSDVWYGMGMQLLLYLFALEREGEKRYGKPVVPAGVLYVPARDVLIQASRDLSDEALSKEKAKLRRRSGLILNDAAVIAAMERAEVPEYLPVSTKKDGSFSTDALADTERFETLRGHVDRRMLELGGQLACGRIEALPYYRGEQDNACLYCPYRSVCRFDEGRDKRRYLAKLRPAEFWESVEGERCAASD
ncbi:MAG: PD-(D/E)XK nuclease family protein [Oscillospiraceae bacterium]|jgi:ATP-dependent helicase/nuclease subunit B|nr:PD-(D/E)XK nuclease family protein [Oscillospiraceae bacterium]